MKTLPPGVTRYATSPEFSERRLPENLLGSHRTKAGTWARIVVLEGRLRYRVLEPEIRTVELSPDRPGIVEPEITHHLELRGRVRFRVEFFR